MRAPAAVLALTLAAVVVAVCQGNVRVTSLPPDPHCSLSVEGECLTCHEMYLQKLEPHKYVIPVDEMCLRDTCHSPDQLGRSHPRGVEVRGSTVVSSVPENLPLEDGRVSCGSCHKPHDPWLSTSRSYPTQKPELLLVSGVGGNEVETPYYRSFYLRIAGTAAEGFVPLCNSCHPR